jgi:hypothetical protein
VFWHKQLIQCDFSGQNFSSQYGPTSDVTSECVQGTEGWSSHRRETEKLRLWGPRDLCSQYRYDIVKQKTARLFVTYLS